MNEQNTIDFPPLLSKLNNAQREAVTATEGFIRIIAGAGSGKTRALSYRFAYLVQELGVLPGNILCVTFTNKASAEMKQRIRQLTGDNDTGYISTFHSFCVTILQEDSHAVQYPKTFFVLDNSDIDDMLQIVYDERGLTLRQMTFGAARDMIEILKLKEKPDYYNDLIGMSLDALQKKYLESQSVQDIIFYGYLYQEKKCFALDYNDLIIFVLYIFEQNEQICLKWQERLEYIMIDEFQDIDEPQYRLMEVLCDYHKNLFVVGDPDQTVYTWRGADIRFLLNFDKKFPDTQTIMLMQNYRSTPQIISCANSLISWNKNRIEKDLVPVLPSGKDVIYHHAKTSHDEAVWVASRIKELTADGALPGDISILYRAHYISRSIEEVLAEEKISFTMYSGIQFFDREEIKDALSYMRMIACRDDLSFRRIVNKPRRNIGKTRMKLIESYAGENDCSLYSALCVLADSEDFTHTQAGQFISLVERFTQEAKSRPASEFLGMLFDAAGYERLLRTEGSQVRLDNIAELKQSIYEFEISCGEDCTLEYYLSHVAFMSALDAGNFKNAVRLMSIHTAKGLEFPHVIICGLNEGIFPSKKVQTPAAMEEERRLAFVALTRAQQSLALTESEGRNFDGSVRFPSRFIFNIDRKYLVFTNELDQAFADTARIYIEEKEQLLQVMPPPEEFLEGTRIKHSVFGCGTITEADFERKAFTIQFDSMSTPRNISFKVRLQKLQEE